MKKSIRIQEHAEIEAPIEEVFAILADPEKHLQLGPAWGQAKLGSITDDYPQPGSSYQLTPTMTDEPPYLTVITALDRPRRISFRVDNASEYHASWEIEDLPGSIRLSYQADFFMEIIDQQPEDSEQEHTDEIDTIFDQSETLERKTEIARREAVEWLTAIKRYAELRETRMRLWLRWLMDRYILRLRSDQRRIILALLAMQLITCITFIAAVVGIGIASALF